MRRITVEEVLEAYRVTGMKPSKGTYCIGLDSNPCGCAMGALAIAAGICPGMALVGNWSIEQFGQPYSDAFEDGFDGKVRRFTNKRAKQGYADGQAAAAAVFQEQGAK